MQELLDVMDAINEHGERLARIGLSRLPKGTWTACDFVDSDGVDLDRLIKINATVTITDDEMIIDWTGSEMNVRIGSHDLPALDGPINLPVGQTEALCSLIFKAMATPHSPASPATSRHSGS